MPKNKGGGESKKSIQKKKEKLVEDKTFGLKNKNKSKKVQAHINSVQKNVMNSGDPKQRKEEEKRKAAKAAAKARKEQAKQEQQALFSEALLAVQKKTTTRTKGGAVEAKGRDAAESESKGGTSRAMKLMYQMDAKEAEQKLMEDPNYVRTLEDEVESQRQEKLAHLFKNGKKGTPITEETFKKWLDAKAKRRAEIAKKVVEAEFKKKKGGKGLSILSGRDLFNYNQTLFVDDADAVDDEEIHRPEVDIEEDDGEHKVDPSSDNKIEDITSKIQSDLFLDGDDEDLDDIEDD